MRSNHKAFRAIKCGMILLWIVLFFPVYAFSQDDGSSSPKLLVGAVVAPPVYIKTADNQWEGFGVEVWQAVAQRLGISFEFREFSSIESVLEALEKKEIDAIPSLVVQDRFESTLDFSQSYLKSGLSIAVPAEGVHYRQRDRSRHLVGDGDNDHCGLWRQSPKNDRRKNLCAHLDDFLNCIYRQLYGEHHVAADHQRAQRQGSRF